MLYYLAMGTLQVEQARYFKYNQAMQTTYFLLNRFSPVAQAMLIADPRVLKLTQTEQSDFRHGMTGGMAVIFEAGLRNQQLRPLPAHHVRSICVRHDHPEWLWFVLHLDDQGLT